MPRYLQSFKPVLLIPKMETVVADRTNMVMSSASCSNRLQTRSLVQFVTKLTIWSPNNFAFQTLNYHSIRENQVSLNGQGHNHCHAVSFHKIFTLLLSGGNAGFNTLGSILALSETAL